MMMIIAIITKTTISKTNTRKLLNRKTISKEVRKPHRLRAEGQRQATRETIYQHRSADRRLINTNQLISRTDLDNWAPSLILSLTFLCSKYNKGVELHSPTRPFRWNFHVALSESPSTTDNAGQPSFFPSLLFRLRASANRHTQNQKQIYYKIK